MFTWLSHPFETFQENEKQPVYFVDKQTFVAVSGLQVYTHCDLCASIYMHESLKVVRSTASALVFLFVCSNPS